MPAEEAMIHAGLRRLRPIVMTALAAVADKLPLALVLGAGSQMLRPLDIAVIAGRFDGAFPDHHAGDSVLPGKEGLAIYSRRLRNIQAAFSWT